MSAARPTSGAARLLRAAWARLAPASFLRYAQPDDRELGSAGEEFAAQTLRRAGFRIVARRLRADEGELDLVALDAGTLVCVEVKTARRRGTRWRPGLRLGPRSLARQRAAARRLARGTWAGTRPRAGRVDLIEVVAPGGAPPALVHHRDLRRVLV